MQDRRPPAESAVPAELPGRLLRLIAGAGLSGLWGVPQRLADLPPAKGAYLLALRLERPVVVALPGRRPAELPAAWYLYLGSARGPGGLGARLARHFRRPKPAHWHIDRLTAEAGALAALAVAGGDECGLTARLLATARVTVPLPGFGSSDCRRCTSHLLALADDPDGTNASRAQDQILRPERHSVPGRGTARRE